MPWTEIVSDPSGLRWSVVAVRSGTPRVGALPGGAGVTALGGVAPVAESALIAGIVNRLIFKRSWVVVIARWGGRRGRPLKYRFPDRASAETAAGEYVRLLGAGQTLPTHR